MRSLKQIFMAPKHGYSDHLLATVFGLLFGILGIFSDTKIHTPINQAIFSLILGLVVGIFISLSAANYREEEPKKVISLGYFYAVRIAALCFSTMYLAELLI
ncbi:MAG: hypothetical protein WCN88_04425 [Candidatus Falkowbacteria bacterium]